MLQTAIVILNWNGLKYLQLFLPSVVSYSQEARIYLADNNSTDGSVEFVKTKYSNVIEVIDLPENGGYSKGYNVALKNIFADIYVLLNSDVEVTPGWLLPVVELLEKNPEAVACQPKIKSYSDKTCFEYAGAGGGFIDYFGYPFCRGRIFNDLEKDHGQYNDVREVFWASGACLFIKSKVYWEMGGFDEDFFAHMEEIDLCWRIKNAGYKIFYCGLSEVFHLGGGTLDKSSPRKTYLNFRNGLALLYKNLPEERLFWTIFRRMNLDGIAAFKFLFFDSFGHFWAVLKAHYAYYMQLGKLRRKRKSLQALVKKYDQPLIFPYSIVMAHYIRKIKTFKELNWPKND